MEGGERPEAEGFAQRLVCGARSFGGWRLGGWLAVVWCVGLVRSAGGGWVVGSLDHPGNLGGHEF
jgi:hypothetical protein